MALTISDVQTVDIPVPADMATRIDSIAAARHVSRDRALADLLRDAIAAYENRRAAFLELADRFQHSTDPAETEQLRGELAQMTFGD
jgi:metal-responsive CopG/Arc/MetJ family transcriptional regulator